ncbi:MAG: hypothetical protein QOG04_1659 [Actinomycetota bacterium]|jgi:hypothetical protein|nr:hypothetical protein [Actinomycetota bacterium]
MEIEGHPTQDIVEELSRRGAIRADGTSSGPNPEALRFIQETMGDVRGSWMFLPRETYLTGMDEVPNQ